jgi:ABC-type lipoprotein export system ATPase subunit
VSRAGILELDDVVKHYTDAGEVIQAVDGVSLTLKPSEICVIYGPSGSGKTTLLLLAAGLLAPDAGAVSFEGRNLAELSERELIEHQRHQTGLIYQSPHLLQGVPAVENAAVKLLSDGVSLPNARYRASDWLERVGLLDRLAHTPDRLSGGERQRVAIARALVNEPRLILADEPTGHLDSRRGMQILELLAGIAREREAAVLLVTHDPQAASIADCIYRLQDGRLLGAELDGDLSSVDLAGADPASQPG